MGVSRSACDGTVLIARGRKVASASAVRAKKKKKYLPQREMEFIYGFASLEMALENRSRIMEKLIYVDSKEKNMTHRLKRLINMAKELEMEVERRPLSQINAMVGNKDANHQGVCMIVSKPKVPRAKAKQPDSAHSIELLMDHLVDIGNIASGVRTGCFFGVDRIIMSENTGAAFPAVSRISAGAFENMQDRIYRGHPLADYAREARGLGWTVLGTGLPPENPGTWVEPQNNESSLEDGITAAASAADSTCSSAAAPEAERTEPRWIKLEDFVPTGPTMVVVGNEAHGLHKALARSCDVIATIPGNFESLNVGVATGIVLSHIRGHLKWPPRADGNGMSDSPVSGSTDSEDEAGDRSAGDDKLEDGVDDVVVGGTTNEQSVAQ